LQFDVRQIRVVNEPGVCQVSFLFLGLFRENVAFEGVFSLDLTRTSDREAFLRTGFCFHFRHFSFNLKSEHFISFVIIENGKCKIEKHFSFQFSIRHFTISSSG
jgi:hypothetical protein